VADDVRTPPTAALAGAALAATGAFAYAVTIVIGRRLASAGVASSVGLGVRFTLASIVLLAAAVVLRRPLLPAKGERVAAFLLGAVGYAVESTLFYLGLSEGTAAAVALLFYCYPSLVGVVDAVLSRQWPTRRVAIGLVLSASGAAAVAAGGGDVTISRLGVIWSLAAAISFTAYFVAGERLQRRTDSLTTAAWVAGGAGLSLSVRASLTGGELPDGRWPELVAYGAATGIAFVCMFAALKRIGPSRTAIAMTLEALFAVLLGALVLDERIGPLEMAGGAAILAATALISLGEKRVRGGEPASRVDAPIEREATAP
jgi:drug/metabolite transporter (DMT)-like permease